MAETVDPENGVMIPESVVSHIIARWKKHFSPLPNPPPSSKLLTDLLAEVFWASLEKNESRDIRFRVAILPYIDADWCLPLKEPLRLSRQTLARLAFANRTEDQAFLIECRDETLMIWGLGLDRFTSYLKIEVAGPGRVVVFGDEGPLAVFEQGMYRLCIQSRSEFLNQLDIVFAGGREVDHADQNVRWSTGFWLDVARSTRKQGNGGTILIGPNASLEGLCELPFEIRPQWWLPHTAPDGRDQERLRIIRNMLDRAAEWIGQLTAIDGAVLCSTNFNVRAIGVITIGQTEPILEQTTPFEPEPSRVTLEDLGGTRHQSTARFVASCRGFSAVVVSHDGPVTVFGRVGESETVRVIRRVDCFLGPGSG